MARLQSLDVAAYLSLLLLLLPTATAASYSSLCHSPAPVTDLPIDHHSLRAPLTVPWISTGHFSGGRDLRFAPDDRSDIPRSFSFSPRRSARTTDPAVLHLSATLVLEGTRRHRDARPHSVSFDLEGYYSAATSSAELCMVGSGSYAREDGSGVVILPDAVLRLQLPHPFNLSRPFVTGHLEGADFGAVALVAYADGDGVYAYGEVASCPTPLAAVRGARQVARAGFRSCHRFRALLRGPYSLDFVSGSGGHPAASSLFPLRLRHGLMHLNQMRCADDGAVRAYMVFYANQSDSDALATNYARRRFLVGDEALVADGFWDSSRSQLCFRACRVEVRSGPSRADLAVRECGIGVSFWFPAVWSIRDRSVAAGMIWNTSSNGDDSTSKTSGVISLSGTGSFMGNLSGIKYNYTRVEEAKKQYHSMPALSKERKGRFPGNYSYRDFAFSFSLKKHGFPGYASPVTIGSAFVEGDRLMADKAFARHDEAAEMNKQRLLNISYNLQYRIGRVAFVNGSSPVMPPQRRISAEGIYDTKTGSLCMVACQVTNVSSDCEVLVTFQFAPVDAVERERAVGKISSLRKQSDPFFFEALDFVSDETLYVQEVDVSISRMDMESIMLVISMTLSCVFTALQLRHVKKHPEALPATSITMLVVLALGYGIPLVLNLKAMLTDSRKHFFVQLTSGGSLELNELMLRASTMLAFVLQLRLLQLALSSGRPTESTGSEHEVSSSDAERSTLWICLPLYILGGVVVWIVHMNDGGGDGGSIHARASALTAPRQPAALADNLAAYAGLILDGFLLPQVVSNAFSGSGARALSPWFYAGGTAIRAAPHAYDVFRRQSYVSSWRPSYVYASPRDDLFGVAWDVAIPCGGALLAALVFLQQRLGGAFLCCSRRRSGGYGMVSTISP